VTGARGNGEEWVEEDRLVESHVPKTAKRGGTQAYIFLPVAC